MTLSLVECVIYDWGQPWHGGERTGLDRKVASLIQKINRSWVKCLWARHLNSTGHVCSLTPSVGRAVDGVLFKVLGRLLKMSFNCHFKSLWINVSWQFSARTDQIIVSCPPAMPLGQAGCINDALSTDSLQL